MNKKELIEAIVTEVETISKKDAEAVIEAFKKVVGDTISKDEKVSLVGFGTFEKVEAKGREGKINFGEKKGQTYKTEDGFRPKFTAGKELKDKVSK
ncbi:HU family DNA-binding protein [Clostridium sp.]|uniref:HU family DNA-binding protein n=1 Tax=Clostridium sp. TaxID=1506 RepID=UPI002628308B|nr:HU family DNA-binding protein [Clostridium sp.]